MLRRGIFFFAQMDSQPDVYGVSLMVDLDRFKSIIDRCGHIAGDAVIQGVAAALRDNMRPQDLICRYGGEESVIFLHEHKRDDGYVAAERLRTAIAATLIPFEGGQPECNSVNRGGFERPSCEYYECDQRRGGGRVSCEKNGAEPNDFHTAYNRSGDRHWLTPKGRWPTSKRYFHFMWENCIPK